MKIRAVDPERNDVNSLDGYPETLVRQRSPTSRRKDADGFSDLVPPLQPVQPLLVEVAQFRRSERDFASTSWRIEVRPHVHGDIRHKRLARWQQSCDCRFVCG